MARYIEDRSAATLFVQGSLESLLPEASVARTLWSGLSRSRKGLRRGVKKLGEVIASKLSEESSGDSLEALRGRKARLERALEEMTALGKTGDGDRMTITEPEASKKKLKNGSFAPAHNVQVVTDLGIGAIVHHLNWRRCRTWGKQGAQAEALWRQITHNLLLLTRYWQPIIPQTTPTG